MTAIGCSDNIYRLIYENRYGYKTNKIVKLISYDDRGLKYSEITIGKDGKDVEEFFMLDLRRYKILELKALTAETVAA